MFYLLEANWNPIFLISFSLITSDLWFKILRPPLIKNKKDIVKISIIIIIIKMLMTEYNK